MKLKEKHKLEKSLFIKNGYCSFKNLLSEKKSKDLNDKIINLRKLGKNIFLSKENYIKKKKSKKKYISKNILDNFSTDYFLKNKKLLKKVQLLLGKNYELYASRVICAIPHIWMPKWITKKMDLESPNIGEFIKDEFRDIRFFHGIDYHMDLIDFSKEDANFITVYIYLDKVTKKMSPLNILPKSHMAGSDPYPHKLLKHKDKVIYQSDLGKKIVTKPKELIGSAGDVWAWHGCLLHGTNFNVQGNIPRLSLRLIYRQTKKSKAPINLVNGKIKNTIALKKMRQNDRYSFIKKNYVSKYQTLKG